jgi:hypothetical protein
MARMWAVMRVMRGGEVQEEDVTRHRCEAWRMYRSEDPTLPAAVARC